MIEQDNSLADALQRFFGGAGTTLVGAILGRLMWHVSEVRGQRRKAFGAELLWELPVAFGMGFVGDGVADWLDMSGTASVGVVVALSYLGPRGIEAALVRATKGK